MTYYQYTPEFAEYFRSVETIWLVWTVAVAIFLMLTLYGLRSLSKVPIRDFCGKFRGLIRDEDGAAYSLSFVMVFPIYVLIIALILETTFMLVAKMGTIYAAFAAARTSIVWTTVEKPGGNGGVNLTTTSMAQRAAVQAMVPFASGMHQMQGTSQNANADADAYLKAYKAYTEGKTKNSLRDKYILNKFKYAEEAVIVLPICVGDGECWQQDIEATVFYEAPFLLPYIGRLLGGEIKNFSGTRVVSITMTSKATLLNECPKNPSGSLGINYATTNPLYVKTTK